MYFHRKIRYDTKYKSLPHNATGKFWKAPEATRTDRVLVVPSQRLLNRKARNPPVTKTAPRNNSPSETAGKGKAPKRRPDRRSNSDTTPLSKRTSKTSRLEGTSATTLIPAPSQPFWLVPTNKPSKKWLKSGMPLNIPYSPTIATPDDSEPDEEITAGYSHSPWPPDLTTTILSWYRFKVRAKALTIPKLLLRPKLTAKMNLLLIMKF